MSSAARNEQRHIEDDSLIPWTELSEINKFRRYHGLPLLRSRTYRCMRCNGEFQALQKTAWCVRCRDTAHSSIESPFEAPG